MNLIQVDHMYKFFKDYTVEFEEPMKKEKSLLAAHPHGILDHAYIMNGNFYYPNTGIGASRAILSIPLNGMLLKWCGAVPVRIV